MSVEILQLQRPNDERQRRTMGPMTHKVVA